MESKAANPLLQLITDGRIQTSEELKAAYHRIVMSTHPDAVGSDRHLERFLRLSSNYQEAKALLSEMGHGGGDTGPGKRPNPRLAFFQRLDQIETIEAPYAFHAGRSLFELLLLRQAATRQMRAWHPEWEELYGRADGEYAAIKREKPSGPYLKNALALNVRPLVHNLIAFHLTGRALYATQARQNLAGIMHRLEEKGCPSLHELLTHLLEDMKAGPAILE